ncbi:MAG TPA: hypothetical protein VEB21_07810 [Terriglobales bacterium]|nr:hypothetical protein [Terriglobales bacterium]
MFRIITCSFVVAASLCTASMASAAEMKLPNELGKARLGMTDEQAKKEIEGLTIKVADASNSSVVPQFHYGEGATDLGKIGPLTGCTGRLRFFQHELININTTCSDKAATEAYLRKTYGDPAPGENFLRWQDGERVLTYSTTGGNFDLADKAKSDQFNMQLLALVMQAQGKRPAASGSPAATPVITPAAQP